ncbi:hypothetical protein DFH09DRAFT_1187259 [Mycena vulgaris]|nr:hypothetical protein DFH09DRAFT_1187259 [Mycena vulgaris]
MLTSQKPVQGGPARSRRRARTALQLPPEICATICEDVGRADLIRLCRVARLFRDQAQRLLYRTVDLKHAAPQALRSWCLAITRNPQLAERVHTLSLGLPYDLSFSSDAEKIARALSRCINLKELSIQPDNASRYRPMYEAKYHPIQGWIINKCPFRLTKFANAYFRNAFIAQFWTPQSEIRVLSLPTCNDAFPCYDDQLPNLIGLEVGGVQCLPRDRALERIQLRLRRTAENLAQLSVLHRYSATLTTLNLLQESVTQRISTRDIVEKVARELPGLLHLGLTEIDQSMTVPALFFEDSPITALAKLTKLQTFVIYCQNITAFKDWPLNREYALADPAGVTAFALAIMSACPALRRAVVGARIYVHPDRVGGYSGSTESVFTLTRSEGGKFEAGFGTKFDFAAVSMFWKP